MTDAEQEQIDRLLRDGLDHYGIDEIAEALRLWERVLALDPDNSQALDYLGAAERRSVPRPRKNVDGDAKSALERSRDMMRRGEDAAAYDLLHSLESADKVDLEFEATVDLVRSRLYKGYLERVADMDCVPLMRADLGTLEQYDLPPGAGFLLSAVDGDTSVADLISLSGSDVFQALHVFNGLLDAGILELPPE
jgi:hypothetical protein